VTYPKTLVYDLEVGEGVGTFYQAYDTNIKRILQHKYILCFSYAWYDYAKALEDPEYVPRVKTVSLDDFPVRFKNNPFDDYDVVRELHALVEIADNRIAYNGKKFDDRVSNTRFTAHKMSIIDTFQCKMIDPMRTIKRELYLEKNDLNSACEHFGIPGKTKVTYGDVDIECSQLVNWWEHNPIEIVKKAWKLMNLYCANDSAILYRLYTATRGLDRMHPNVTLITRRDGCPTCGSTDANVHGYRMTNSGKVKKRLKCNVCGHTYTERQCELVDDFEPLYTN